MYSFRRPPLPECAACELCEEREEAEEGCRDYSEMNYLLRSLHFERLARLASPPSTQREPLGSRRRDTLRSAAPPPGDG